MQDDRNCGCNNGIFGGCGCNGCDNTILFFIIVVKDQINFLGYALQNIILRKHYVHIA